MKAFQQLDLDGQKNRLVAAAAVAEMYPQLGWKHNGVDELDVFEQTLRETMTAVNNARDDDFCMRVMADIYATEKRLCPTYAYLLDNVEHFPVTDECYSYEDLCPKAEDMAWLKKR